MGGARYFVDHNAGAPADARVLEEFLRVEAECPANPSALHRSGRRARAAIEDARDRIAQRFAIDADHVFFVSSGTEANNTAVFGSGDVTLPVLCAAVEHPSVFASAEQRGMVEWSVTNDGTVVVEQPEQPVGLVAITHAQSEVGTLQPIAEARALATDLGVPLHVDASQTLDRVPVQDIIAMADSIAFSAHKVGGIRGMTAWIDKGARTRPRLLGGGQQRGRRAGTESPGLVAATARAIELALDEREDRARSMRAARDAFVREVVTARVRCLTPEHSLPNTAMLCFEGIDGRTILPALDMGGIEASQGSACAAGAPTPPRVLLAMGLDESTARACVRFSFGTELTHRDAADVARLVKSIVLGNNAS